MGALRLSPPRSVFLGLFLGLFLAAPIAAAAGGRAEKAETESVGKARCFAPDPTRAEDEKSAIARYDEGRYAEARAALGGIVAAGRGGGSLRYRYAFTLRDAGDREGEARETDRAIEELEREVESSPSLEAWFYLATAERNRGRSADARRVAVRATSDLDAGRCEAPLGGLDRFRVARLYEDQGRDDVAARWHREALSAWGGNPATPPAYERWSRRFVADDALARADFAEAETQYAWLAAGGAASAGEWARLAVARARLRRWDGAAAAWREVEKKDPSNADDARYAARLAAQAAARTVPLPEADTTGRDWRNLRRDELEAVMTAHVRAARDAIARAAAEPPPTPEERAKLAASAEEAHVFFLAAALEYSVRGFPIRETAFVGGYAPLVFNPDQWEVPAAP